VPSIGCLHASAVHGHYSFAENVVTEWRLYQADTVITADWFISADGTNIPVFRDKWIAWDTQASTQIL